MRKSIYTLLFLFTAAGAFAQSDAKIVVLEVEEFQEKIQQEAVLLVDVRTPEEFSEASIKGATNIDFKAKDFLAKFEEFDKNQPIYIYCRSGNRSARAAIILAASGFKKIIDLKGGFLAWEEFHKQ
ncbi:MAG TPA: rhodanese-like domain-containing protein [Salinimicrobium sp.]|nr:rhodanese-like domain-containing protein [Salinimicrobium sp.]